MAATVKDAILRGRKTVENVVEGGRKTVETVVEGGLNTVETVVEAGLNTVDKAVVKGRRTVESAVSLGRKTVEHALLHNRSTMQAAVLHGREDVRIENVPVPRAGPGELVVRVGAALTCGTDLKVFRRGYHARMIVPPALFGHEMAGTVMEAGEGVEDFAPGGRVVALNSAPCGQCYFCERGQENLCDDLLFNNGAYAEFIRIPEARSKVHDRGQYSPPSYLLLFILAGTFAWGFYLDHYELVYSTLGVVYGAGYAAAHVTRIVFWMMFGASVLACALLALAFFRPRVKPLAIGIGVYALLYLGGVLALPPLVQAFVVRPNELSRETPYLNHYIEFTRNAYNLGGIQETAYPALTDLTPEALS